jgi:hypothetical protein
VRENEMKKLINILILVAALGALTACGDSTFEANNGDGTVNNFGFDDPITPYEEPTDPADRNYTENHCQDINVRERVFHGDLRSISNRRPLESLLQAEGVCTSASNGFQTYPGFLQYEVNGGTNQCSWWSRHGLKVYVNFVQGYRQAAVVTIDATGDGWPRGGGQGFPTARMQFRNALIDCNQDDLTINVNTGRGILQIRAPKETGNKYSSAFRGTVSFNGAEISRGLFYVTR